ncbi:MAG: hypothetical protein WA943_11525 [Parvibaculum sp.]|uniref:hypothetical protein n=1 Tax=Parvibaculum sp. TaxID=2024848 RepID=UPI003C70F142
MRKLLNSIARVIPASWAGRLDHWSNHRKFFYPYGGPMNGQTARLEIVRELIERCGVERIVETGTFRGTTTEWFATFNIPVLSFEVVPRFAAFSRARLKKSPHVRIEIENSVDGLKKIDGPVSERSLFYLDAHWYDYLPLKDEYVLIREKFRRPIIVVDDFKVPSDSGYTYDDYGPGMALTLEYLSAAFDKKPSVFFPKVSAKWETGLRRGCVVITTDDDLAALIDSNVPLLERWLG